MRAFRTRLAILLALAVATMNTLPTYANSGDCGGRSYGCPGR